MREIEKLRAEIDLIHGELAELLQRRLQVTEKIWKIKIEEGLPFFDGAREELILKRFDESAKDEAERQMIRNVLKSILSENKKYLETKLK